MLVPGVLGFESIVLALVCVVWLVIRHKWRDEAAKKEEIMRLVAIASQETAMAEVEATVEYTSMPVVRRFQCAVCYNPTTRRCSQCKAVRYCSGKCQIMHWRQGHKDECCLSIASMQFQDNSDFSGKAILEKESEIFDTEGLHNGFASSGASFSAGFSPSCVGGNTSVDISSNQVIRSSTVDRSEKPLSDGVAPDMLGTTASFSETELTMPPPIGSTNLVNSVGHNSCANISNKVKSGHIDEVVDFKSQFSKAKPVLIDNVKPANMGNSKPTRGSALGGKLVADASRFRHSPSLSCSGSDSVGDEVEDDSESSKCKEVRSLSCNASSDRPSSATGGHLVSNSKSAKIDGFHALPTKVSSAPSLPQDIRNGLKKSVRKVVQQFRAPKESKLNLSGRGNEMDGKNNCKIVFPYEQFMKLYCCDKVELCPFGLTNCGNSCYANAVLQCLAFTRPLATYLLHGLHSKSCRKKGWCFICEFECLIQNAREGYSPLSPIGILSKIHKIGSNLGHGREEDAHEFLRYAVDTMQSVCLKEVGTGVPLAEETTLVGLTFGGYLRSKIRCMKCLGKSERYERMMDLTVEIDGNIGTLEEALTQFTATETLDRDNKYYCGRCKTYEKAKKKLTILESPNILTIVLKRFQSGNFEKLNKSIQFPVVLDMAPYISGVGDKSPSYSLYAVVVHLDSMNASFSGHYVCYVKNFNGEWFRIDDSTVEPVELERVLLERAYMLLYARHYPRAPAFIRNNVVSHGGRSKKRNLEAVPSSISTSKTESNAVGAHQKLGRHNNQSFHPDNWRFHSMQRVAAVDSSSESSSLFSSSDASSCSTASIKDSASTGDLSDYIFGEVRPGWYSHYGLSSDSISSSSYGNLDADSEVENNNGWAEDLDGDGNSAILYTDTTRHHRKSSCQFGSSSSYSSRDTYFEQFGYANPSVVNSGVSLRRPKW
ncbi:ubiquitin carboxyl-terminal hydrolase 17 [Alnus glutinosa]|uniref:ubiquitin carboxyl-terminal hydrolase 17 n=1 Tax=Alnus glutinosa TaxID=3517 RepID=UPI002D766F87|nr:ubiquitin carboxyl-terminal hydrolase 17 [Alnus glutinosa]XP_062154834.1 ubiquitin carboxyl-terminal hydrolase 17 [Alnus glutinosa]